MRRLVILLCVAAGLIVPAACARQPSVTRPSAQTGPPKLIWSGTSAGYNVRWTAGDITAAPIGAPASAGISELGLTIVDFHGITRKQTADCDFTRVTQLQSVVGPIVSIQDLDSMKCANGTVGTGRKVAAIDLRHASRPALLSDYFSPAQLAPIQTRISKLCPSQPATLLNRFAFHQVKGNAVIVDISLPVQCSVSVTQAALPTPATLQHWLLLAAARKAGFLVVDQPLVARGQTTTINYHYRTG